MTTIHLIDGNNTFRRTFEATGMMRGVLADIQMMYPVGDPVIYVWDVYDAKGNRVHRISGQEKARAGSGEGWDAVPNSSMQAIGNSTVEQFASWVASHG